jgi:5-methylcytosine-specific restriction protein A
MPKRPPRPCGHSGCPALVSSGRCARHRRPASQDTRPSARQRGYDRKWERLRAIILQRDPVCRLCRVSPSRHADHIIARANGGSDHPSNLQGTCASCHSRKTAAQDGGFGNRRKSTPRKSLCHPDPARPTGRGVQILQTPLGDRAGDFARASAKLEFSENRNTRDGASR